MKETCNALYLAEILGVDEREIRRLAQKSIVKKTAKGEYKLVESIQATAINAEKKFLARVKENLGDKAFDALKITIEIIATRELSNNIMKVKTKKQLMKVLDYNLLSGVVEHIENILGENKRNGK